MVIMAIKFNEFSEKAREIALRNARRKAIGKRISFYINDQFFEEGAKAYKYLLAENPKIEEAIVNANRAKIKAGELGFNNLKEFQELQGFAKKNFLIPNAKLSNQEILSLGRRPLNQATAQKLQESLKRNKGLILNNLQKPTGEVIAVPQQVGRVRRLIQQLNDLQKIKSTSSIRNKQNQIKNELQLLGLTVGTGLVSAVQSYTQLPKLLRYYYNNPLEIKKIPKNISDGSQNFGQLIRISPTEAFAKIGTEVFIAKGTGQSLKIIGKVNKGALTKIGVFKGVKKTPLNIKVVKGIQGVGDIEIIPKGKGKKLMKRELKGSDIPAITGAFGKTKSQLRESIGKSGTLVTAQVDFFGRNKLKKLDRFLYATPFKKGGSGQVRISRLGLNQAEAKLLDYLLGEEINFRSNKPEVLIFPKEKITSKGLITSKERFVKTKGFSVPEFSNELEVVLGKGYSIKKGKILRRVNLEGRIVPFREVKKVKISPTSRKIFTEIRKERKVLENGLNKKSFNNLEILSKSKNIIKKELSLNKRLKKELGYNPLLSSSIITQGKKIPLKRILTGLTLQLTRRKKKPTRPKRTGVKKKPTRPKRTGVKKKPTRPLTLRSSLKPKGSRRLTIKRLEKKRKTPMTPKIKRVPKGLVRKPIPLLKPRQFTRKNLIKSKPTFYVITRKNKRIVKLFAQPLSLNDARDYLAYSIDNNLTKTAWLVPLGSSKKVVVPPKKIKGYFNKVSRKLRPYKIKFGKKKQLVNGYIEKRKFFQDTTGEKLQLKRSRKRKVLLNNLKKARWIRSKKGKR